MSSILYYSNYCDNCKQLLQIFSRLSSEEFNKEFHFINIDNRVKRSNEIYIILDNKQEILLPPTVTSVPALLFLDKGYQVIYGNDILNYLENKQEQTFNKDTNNINKNNDEPSAFLINSNSNSYYGVTSDTYSFLDQNADDLSTKGNGGMRQQHHYVGLDYKNTIETPPDNYSPDKIGKVTVEYKPDKI